MPNVLRNPYSNTAGNTPSSLGNGQIAVNQADGRLFYRASNGAVATFSSIASYATTGQFPATGLSNVLYLASDSSRAFQFAGGVYVEVGVAGGGGGTPASHAASHAASGSDPLTLSASQISGLGSLATANSVAYSSLTGTPTSFTPSSHTHAAGEIVSGTVATARLGSGTANSTTYLRGDQTWATVAAGSSSASDLTSGTLSQARLDFTPLHPFLLMGG